MRELDKIEGHVGLNEGYLMFKIAKSLKDGAVILEIGAFKGKSTCFIAKGIGSKRIQFYTIDTWFNDGGMREAKEDTFPHFLKNTAPFKDRIIPLRGYSYEIRKTWPDEKMIDLLWIDGDHSYEGVKRDIQDWLPLLKRNHVVCFHDYRDAPGVRNAVEEILSDGAVKFIKTEGCILMAERQ